MLLLQWIIYSFTKNVLFATITIGSHTYGHHQVRGSISIIKLHARAVIYDKVRKTRTCNRTDKSLETMKPGEGKQKRETILQLRRLTLIGVSKRNVRQALFFGQLGMALPSDRR